MITAQTRRQQSKYTFICGLRLNKVLLDPARSHRLHNFQFLWNSSYFTHAGSYRLWWGGAHGNWGTSGDAWDEATKDHSYYCPCVHCAGPCIVPGYPLLWASYDRGSGLLCLGRSGSLQTSLSWVGTSRLCWACRFLCRSLEVQTACRWCPGWGQGDHEEY